MPGHSPATAHVELDAVQWATGLDGKTAIDLIDVGNSTGEANPVLALAEAHDHPDGIQRALPADAVLPRGFALGDAWVLATPAGPARGTAIAFGAVVGASETHFVVVLDGEHTGLAARADAWNGRVPDLRIAAPIDLGTEPGSSLLAALGPGLIEVAEADAAAVLQRTALTPTHVTAVAGRFPNGSTHLISIRLVEQADTTADHVAALVLADATGHITPILPPRLTTDSYELRFLVDLDGDDIDEAIYDSRHYEGRYVKLLAWSRDGHASHRTLTGDGA
jgi:hypothetical protein